MEELQVTKREKGKKLGTLRRSGNVPGVLYGPQLTEPLSVAVPEQDFVRVFSGAGESSLVRVVVDGDDNPYTVLIRETQKDVVSEKYTHFDLYALRLDEEVEVDVALHFEGEAPLEAQGEGVVAKELHELTVKAQPHKLPSEIVVDISGLEKVDDAIYVKDLPLPEGVVAVADEDAVVARAAALLSEEEIEALEEEGAMTVEDVEVVGEEAEGEEGEEGEAAEEGEQEGEVSEGAEEQETA